MALITKTYGNILAALLTLLGFSPILSSCAKYGAPCTSPQITGSVVSAKNYEPIQGIRVVLKEKLQGYDTAYTAKNGGFYLQSPHHCIEDGINLLVELKDLDGLFQNLEIKVVSESKQKLGTIKMTPKE